MVRQEHDHRLVVLTTEDGSARHRAFDFGCGLSIAIAFAGALVSLLAFVHGAFTTHDPSGWTLWLGALGGLLFGTLLPVALTVDRPLRAQVKGRTIRVRVGASWVQVDEGPRIAFDAVHSVVHDGDALTVTTQEPIRVPDPQALAHAELLKALAAWRPAAATADQLEGAMQQQSRLAALQRNSRLSQGRRASEPSQS
jgi:hypothetical protein